MTKMTPNLEQTCRMVFNQSLDAFTLNEMIFDSTGRPVDSRFLAVNQAFEKVFGRSSKTVVGKTFQEVFKAIPPTWLENCHQVIRMGEPCRYEESSPLLGSLFEVTCFPLHQERFAVQFRDHAEQKGLEKALLGRDEKYRTILEDIEEGYYEVDLTGAFTFVNEAMCHLFGYSKEEFIGMNNRQV
ncbi:MAG: hypothetical protein C0407_13035, partial [Desulfobacca sp.]|nr:hypothetical protein [Desulfobacca sp.]